MQSSGGLPDPDVKSFPGVKSRKLQCKHLSPSRWSPGWAREKKAIPLARYWSQSQMTYHRREAAGPRSWRAAAHRGSFTSDLLVVADA